MRTNPRTPSTWQKAQVKVDAFPNRVLSGHIKTIDTVASQQDWFASDVKVYKTMISIDQVAGWPQAGHERGGDHLRR